MLNLFLFFNIIVWLMNCKLVLLSSDILSVSVQINCLSQWNGKPKYLTKPTFARGEKVNIIWKSYLSDSPFPGIRSIYPPPRWANHSTRGAMAVDIIIIFFCWRKVYLIKVPGILNSHKYAWSIDAIQNLLAVNIALKKNNLNVR